MQRAACFLIAAAALKAASTMSWEMNTYQDFLKGRFDGVSLSRDGRLSMAPRLETFFASEQPAVWCLAAAPEGAVYAGTGHRGRVFRIERTGKSSLFWTAGQPEVFALAVDARGTVWAGSSPNGKVYRIEKNGQAKEFFAPGEKYIWALAWAPDGSLFVGTGDQGKVFRVDSRGSGEVYYETGQAHVTALAFDAAGRLLAGTEPNGILYRVLAKDKAFVLHDANLPEIRAIVSAPDGSIYAAALGGGVAGRPGAPASLTGAPQSGMGTPAVSTSITVEAQGPGLDVQPKPDAAKPQPPTAGAPLTAPYSPVIDLSGVEKSAVYRIHPDHTVETLWSSKEENVYDLLLSGGEILLATDGRGRLYRLSPDRKPALIAQTNEGEPMRLLETPGGLLAAGGSAGKVFRLAGESGAAGVYEAPVHDASAVARWGRLNWRAETPGRSRIAFRTRTGNSARPDRTWSDWSEPILDPAQAAVRSPNARYIQWKAEFTGDGAAVPSLESVAIAYLPQNTPPAVRSVHVATIWGASPQAKTPAPAPSSGAAYSITVTDTGDAGPASAGTPTQALTRAASQQIQVTWQAEDSDGDRLVYTLEFRGEDEREWKTLKKDLTENSFTLDGDALADGRYFFRVTASDRLANPPSTAREAELVSAPVLIDGTPPVVTLGAPRAAGGRLEIDVEARDAASAIRRAEYSLNAGPWAPLELLDGVADSPHERFLVRLEGLTPGEHLIVVRAYDASGNAGLAKAVSRQ